MRSYSNSGSIRGCIFVLLKLLLYQITLAQKVIENLSCDFHDDTLCAWSFQNGDARFEPIFNYTNFDYNVGEDRVLVFRASERNKIDGNAIYSIKSPSVQSGDYELSFNVNMNFAGNIQIVVQEGNTESQILKVSGNRHKIWDTYSVQLPKYLKMSILFEIQFDVEQLSVDSDYVAVNFLHIIDRRTSIMEEVCDYKCVESEKCLVNDYVCDTIPDCPKGDDETLAKCDSLPAGSYCTFDRNFCHWYNFDNANSSGQWIHVQNTANDGYLGVVFNGAHRFGSISYLKSVMFEPIPLYHSVVSSKYYRTCKARFSYRFSLSSNDLALELEPLANSGGEKAPASHQLWRIFNSKLSYKWENVSVPLPVNFHHKYRLKFGTALGLKRMSTFSQQVSVAIDNFSLSKECFGIDVPESEPRTPVYIPVFASENSFVIPKNKSIKSYTFTSCGAQQRHGPSYSQCESFYLNTSTRAAVFENENLNLNGSQMWTVPISAYYTIFAKGADGGRGLYKHGGGIGALVRAVFYFQEGDTIFLSVGQAGSDACSDKTKDFEPCKSVPTNSKIEIGGGGGGGTFVFKFKPYLPVRWVPLLIAGGGGGGSGKFNPDFKYSTSQHGRGFDFYNTGTEGSGDGSGGGWNYTAVERSNQTGKSLLFGADGGLACKRFAKWQVDGGFGGGGGACSAGGGGGGYHGGNTNRPSEAGDGGTSFADFGQSSLQLFSDSSLISVDVDHVPESGLVVIIPQIDHCCNDHKFPCLLTGESPNGTEVRYCICGNDKFILDVCVYHQPIYLIAMWIAFFICLILFVLFFSFLVIQKRSAKKKKQMQNSESNDMHLLSNSSTDIQLSRLRSHNIITEYNPNYEFGGSTCTLQDLKEIHREKLNLVKALGQGAFGEVYQGYLQNMPGEATEELPVAVKTLPEYSANKQAEMDFLMEALIMSKFKHRNIVRFIGICFEKMPRFIILELLPGGDLKTFLREHRSTVDHPANLVIGDLLVMALDVASGCQYLEENHFIHRDIAARNCLLTSKLKMPSSDTNGNMTPSGTFDINNYKNGFHNSGITVKIADFGMARDIYRADYYRKGGKAMLPVKWMPPEAFLDGVFTSKTDVWSFGVLLWEVMSMGYMPYPGRGNQEVMQLVTAGGRLEPPNTSTPPQVYAIMTQCWNGTPELRPSFSTIIERIGYCLQDINVLNVPLPVFHRAASMEKDMTLMRPPPDATDYLIPNNPGSQTNSNYSMATEKTELLSPDTCSTLSCINDDKLLEIEDHIHRKLWNDNLISNRTIPFNHLNQMPNHYGGETNLPFNSEIVLNPNTLAYQPSVRYVNVNVNSELFTPLTASGVGGGAFENSDKNTTDKTGANC